MLGKPPGIARLEAEGLALYVGGGDQDAGEDDLDQA